MQRSDLALAVLALLLEEPMHPYRMQRLIKSRGKNLVINVVQRSQLYKTIDRLRAEGLITVADVEREAALPGSGPSTPSPTAAPRPWSPEPPRCSPRRGGTSRSSPPGSPTSRCSTRPS